MTGCQHTGGLGGALPGTDPNISESTPSKPIHTCLQNVTISTDPVSSSSSQSNTSRSRLVGESSLPATDPSCMLADLPSIQEVLLDEGITMSTKNEVQEHYVVAVMDAGMEMVSSTWMEEIGMDCPQKPPVRLKHSINK